jgi:mandelate racemase
MPDIERIGGVSGWLGASQLAAERGIRMSSHLYSEASAHLLAVTPTAHYLEYVDWADKVVQEPLKIADGHAVIPDRPGIGIVWDKAAVDRYRV